jgi:hypothetical protein
MTPASNMGDGESPQSAFIKSRRYRAFSGTLFVVSFPLISKEFTKVHPSAAPVLTTIFAVSLFLEALLDVANSFWAEIWGTLPFSKICRLGVIVELFGYVLLAICAIWPALAGQNYTMAIALPCLAYAAYAFGFTLDSGTFEAWAVNQGKLDRAFDRAALYIAAKKNNRAFTLLATTAFALPGLYFQVPNLTAPIICLGASVVCYIIYLRFLSKSVLAIADENFGAPIATRQRAMRNALTVQAIRDAFDPSSIPIWLLLGFGSTITNLVTFSWPILAKPLGIFTSVTPLILALTGLIGVLIAERYKGRLESVGVHRERLEALASLRLTLAAGIIVLSSGIFLYWSPSSLWALVLIAVARLTYYAALPFQESLLHEFITLDEVRGTVISLRSAFANLLSGCMWLTISLFIVTREVTVSTQQVSWACVVCGALIAVLAFILHRRDSKRTEITK